MIVLDTNVLSELMRLRPARTVEIWVEAQPRTSLFTTAITQAEILYGLALLAAGRRRDALVTAADAIFEVDLAFRVLPFAQRRRFRGLRRPPDRSLARLKPGPFALG